MIKHDCCLVCPNNETCHLNETEYTIEELKGLCKVLDKENGWLQTEEEKEKVRNEHDETEKMLEKKYGEMDLLKKEITLLEEKVEGLLYKIIGVDTYY